MKEEGQGGEWEWHVREKRMTCCCDTLLTTSALLIKQLASGSLCQTYKALQAPMHVKDAGNLCSAVHKGDGHDVTLARPPQHPEAAGCLQSA